MIYNLKRIDVSNNDTESFLIKSEISEKKLEMLIKEYNDEVLWATYLSLLPSQSSNCNFEAFVLFLKDRNINVEVIEFIDVILSEYDSS